MLEVFDLALLPAILAGVVTYISVPLVIRLAWKLGLIDDPKKSRHPKVIHTEPTPRGGGIAIFLGVVVSALVFLPFDLHMKAILAGALIIIVMGIADDKWNLNPYLRLIVQIVAAAIPIVAGIGISFITNPIGVGVIDLPMIVADIFALLWIVTLMNFLNMGAKGVDGQLPGVTSIAAFTIAVMSLKFSADIAQWPVITLAAITAGAYLAFLPWNAYPQKIMPAFGGSSLAGYLLGILSILSTSKVGTLAVVLGVPLIDTGYTVVRRILSGKSPVWGDTGHLHHRLLSLGWSKAKVARFYWLITAALGIIALNLKTLGKFYTIIGVGILVGGLILWATYRPKKKKGANE